MWSVMFKLYVTTGEEISENYGLMYTTKDFGERQKILLNHYKFECICQPCTEKWPTLMAMTAELNLDPEDIRMNRFQKIRCIKCGETIRYSFAFSVLGSAVLLNGYFGLLIYLSHTNDLSFHFTGMDASPCPRPSNERRY